MAVPHDAPRERRRIDSLRPHPRQDALFTPPTEAEVAALAADIKARGMKQPVETLPDGTIVCGHSRVAAARRLGWDEVDVIVRRDLGDQPDEEVELTLIQDNTLRRQLSKFQKLRALRRCWAIQGRTPPWTADDKEAIRQALNEPGMGDKNLSRYLRILDADPRIGQWFDQDGLALADAARLAGLPSDRQGRALVEIGRRRDAGEPVGRVVKDVLKAHRATPPAAAVETRRRLIRHLEALVALEEPLTRVPDDDPCDEETVALALRATGVLVGFLDRCGVTAEDEPDREGDPS